MFTPSSSATLFLYRRPGIDSISLQRETVHEHETREGAREASLERMDIAEERVGLYVDAIETGREQSDRLRVTSHPSVLKDRQGMKTFYPALWLREVRRVRLMVSWDTRVPTGNLAHGFVLFNDAAYHVGPCFRWDAIVRLTWTCMLL